MIIPENIRAMIFDCDGVLIESVSRKTDTFVDLVQPTSSQEETEIRNFHAKHPGIHRVNCFQKIHREILDRPLSEKKLESLCDQFHQSAKEFMPELPLVEGLRPFLETHQDQFEMYVVSGTPQDELENILERQGIAPFFRTISGSPPGKPERAKKIIADSTFSSEQFVLIGDAQEDLEVADELNIPMIFRPSTDQVELDDPGIVGSIQNFTELSVE